MNEEFSPYYTTAEAAQRSRLLFLRPLAGTVLAFAMIIVFSFVGPSMDQEALAILIGFLGICCGIAFIITMSIAIVSLQISLAYRKFAKLCKASEDLLAQGDNLALMHSGITHIQKVAEVLPSITANTVLEELTIQHRMLAGNLHHKQRALLTLAFSGYGRPSPWQLPKPKAIDQTRDRLIREGSP
mgnify:CR=1 FL=1|jgi:hypothetical protein